MKRGKKVWSVKTVTVNVKEGTPLTSLISELCTISYDNNSDLVVSSNMSFVLGDCTCSEVNRKYEVEYEEK